MKIFLNYLLSNTIKSNFLRLDMWCVKKQTLILLGIFRIELVLCRSKSYSIPFKAYSWVPNKPPPPASSFSNPPPLHCLFGPLDYFSFQIFFYSTIPKMIISSWETTYEIISPLSIRKTCKKDPYLGSIVH